MNMMFMTLSIQKWPCLCAETDESCSLVITHLTPISTYFRQFQDSEDPPEINLDSPSAFLKLSHNGQTLEDEEVR
jgi:hypothetical protein